MNQRFFEFLWKEIVQEKNYFYPLIPCSRVCSAMILDAPFAPLRISIKQKEKHSLWIAFEEMFHRSIHIMF